MKKSICILLAVFVLIGLVMTSCNNDVQPVEEELVYVSFGEMTSRALTATLETFDAKEYYWSYEAKKNDGSGLKSGETAAWNENGNGSVQVQAGKGLNSVVNNVSAATKIPGFSKGYWDFRLFAYKDSDRTVLAYWGEADGVLIDNDHHLASVIVSPTTSGDGYLKIGTITFNPASASSVPTDLIIFTDVLQDYEKVTEDPEEWDWVNLNPQPVAVEGVYTLAPAQYKFTRTYSYLGIPVASGSVIVTVYSNLTTTISGSLSELTSYAQFAADQNPDAVNVCAEATGITYDDSTATAGYVLKTPSTEKAVTAAITKNSVDKIMESIQESDSAIDLSASTTKMTLALGVDTTGATETTIEYEINMTATINYKETVGTETVSRTTVADVKNVADYVTAVIQMQTGLDQVSVKHSGLTMEEISSPTAYDPDDDTSAVIDGVEIWAGFYNYNKTTGVLTIVTRSFSPFTLSYVVPSYVAAIGTEKYTTLVDAVGALKDGDTLTLLADLDFSKKPYSDYGWVDTYNPLEITKNNITFDLNGKTIENMGNCAIAFGHILAKDGRISNVTIKNGTLKAGKTNNVTNSYVLCIAGADGALVENVKTVGGINVCNLSQGVIIRNCDVTGTKYYTVCAQVGSEVTIEGDAGKYFKNTDTSVQSKAMFWIQGAATDEDAITDKNPTGAFKASSITIKAGTFTIDAAHGGILYSEVKPALMGGTYNIDPTACVADGYYARDNGDGTWTVRPYSEDAVAKIKRTESTAYFFTVKDAIDAVQNNETVTLLKDHTLPEKLIINPDVRKTFTLDLNEKTLTGRLNIRNVDLTIKNGNLDAGSMSQAVNVYGTDDVSYAGKEFTVVTICEDVKITGAYGICFFSSITSGYIPLGYGVIVNFYGESNCSSPAYVSGNIGFDNYAANVVYDISGKLPEGITAPSKAMHEYGPVFNVYGKLITTDPSEDGNQGISLSGMVRVNVYEGAEIIGNEGIGMKSGVLNVYGGLIQSVGPKKDPVQAVNSGTEASGAAISISSYYTHNIFEDRAPIEVNVYGGTVKGTNNGAILVAHSYYKGALCPFEQPVNLNVYGGKFICEDAESQLIFVDAKVAGDDAAYPPTEFVAGGLFSQDPTAYVRSGYHVVKESSDFWAVEGLYWIDFHAKDFAGGTGTESDPYQIATAEQLALLAYLLRYDANETTREDYKDKFYKLTADIDLSGKCWVPISNLSRRASNNLLFCGTFDGNDKEISGLTNNKVQLYDGEEMETMTNSTTPADTDGEYTYGLFGTVCNATIKNVVLKDVAIEVGYGIKLSDGKRFVGDSVGALVGCVRGTTSVSRVSVSGSVMGYDATGGIVGRCEDRSDGLTTLFTFSNLENAASVTAIRRSSGIVGYASGYYPAYAEGKFILKNANQSVRASFVACINTGSVESLGPASDYDAGSGNYYGAGALTHPSCDASGSSITKIQDDYAALEIPTSVISNTGTTKTYYKGSVHTDSYILFNSAINWD